ncbi:nuclear transport factor 2 family protein [Mycobacterium sp.]|uniref:nuclear transport factor 2 family protein n=1 Tax=Mycobacterium sp. TaxID=1785 RepID=UPI0025CCECDD|nr:nuclear transport factor 2 family protein [Mycobacterium sp.]
MSDVISKLMEANLLAVFDERDPQRRAETIAKIYSPDVEWIDDEGTTVGREALQAKATELLDKLTGLHFAKASPVHRTRGLGFLAWELRSSDDATVATGFDVAEIADDLIARLWTVMTSE